MFRKLYRNTPCIIYAHGFVGEIIGKTVNGILMHSKFFDVVALIDKQKTGQQTSKICQGVDFNVPIVDSLRNGIVMEPKVLILINEPDKDNIQDILYAIDQGLDIINTTFSFLKQYKVITDRAKHKGVRLFDIRDYQYLKKAPNGSILGISSKVIYVTGTDCGLGKRTATIELVKEAKRRGINAAFAATGQTGILVGCDEGIIYDAIPTNFATAAVEDLIVKLDKRFDLIFLEGQASLMHFGYSTSIGLLHGSNPHAIVLVHDPTRDVHAAMGDSQIFKMNPLNQEISIIEGLSLLKGNNFKVVAVPTIGRENISILNQMTNLPVADVKIDNGSSIILDAILGHLDKAYNWQSSILQSHAV